MAPMTNPTPRPMSPTPGPNGQVGAKGKTMEEKGATTFRPFFDANPNPTADQLTAMLLGQYPGMDPARANDKLSAMYPGIMGSSDTSVGPVANPDPRPMGPLPSAVVPPAPMQGRPPVTPHPHSAAIESEFANLYAPKPKRAKLQRPGITPQPLSPTS